MKGNPFDKAVDNIRTKLSAQNSKPKKVAKIKVPKATAMRGARKMKMMPAPAMKMMGKMPKMDGMMKGM